MSDSTVRSMNLAVFLTSCGNYHHLGWRHPEAWVDGSTNIKRWVEMAGIAERAKLDMLFIADQIAIVGGEEIDAELPAFFGQTKFAGLPSMASFNAII